MTPELTALTLATELPTPRPPSRGLVINQEVPDQARDGLRK